ncbi:MAG: hypothetical protein ACP5KG_07510, partial [Myxococcota bacterium]
IIKLSKDYYFEEVEEGRIGLDVYLYKPILGEPKKYCKKYPVLDALYRLADAYNLKWEIDYSKCCNLDCPRVIKIE